MSVPVLRSMSPDSASPSANLSASPDVSAIAAGIPPAVTPRARLVARARRATQREWPCAFPEAGLWKVTGEAGAGVSSFLVDAAVHAIEQDPQRAARGGVLLLTSSKESGARLRAELTDKLAASGFVADEPVVRSVHSLAFALVRQHRQEDIRLISGAEQDAVIRQLLLGHAEDGRGSWPAELRPALPLVGFARQLRDFLLRAIERGLGPDELIELGCAQKIPIWSAAGEFLREYQQVMALSGVSRYSASELVAQALSAELPRAWDVVIVDDAQHLAPAASELVARLLDAAQLGIVGGDVDQSVFRFRGASPRFFADLGGREHELIDLGQTRRRPSRRVVVAPDAQAQQDFIVDAVRRSHLEEGSSYRDMAVVVRSTPMIEPVRRALLHAGVPVALDPADLVLGEQRIVVSLLLGLRALTEELSVAQWRDLILGPVGGSDPVTLRRLLRGLRRWKPEQRAEDTLQELLASPSPLPEFGAFLTDRELDILGRIRGVLDQGRQALDGGGSVEEVLWAVWSATGLADRLLAAALRGGATGSQADRDLDAAMALFDAAGDFTERRPSAGVELFVASITEQQLPTGVRDRRSAKPDAVALLTAHGAAGREFERVIVAGVQEMSWPSLGETGTLFRQEDLIDFVDEGIDPGVPVSHTAERMVEERRLFHLATSRATTSVAVTAVDDKDSEEVLQPSRFVEEFAAGCDAGVERLEPRPVGATGAEAGEASAAAAGVRVLSRDHIVAELRRALADPRSPEAVRAQAARQLARLAEAGVAGADPGQWWGVKGASTSEKLPRRRGLSPSRIESLLQCPMREVLERIVGLDETPEMIYGSMAHAYLEALGRGVDTQTARDAVIAARTAAEQGPGWKSGRDLEDFSAMLDRIDSWLASSRSAFEQVAVEAEVDVDVDAAVGARIKGRIDRLERDESGALYVVDLKTGSSVPSQADTEVNAQLLAYQLALRLGEFVDGRVSTASQAATVVGGALLVYPNAQKKTLTTRQQAPKSDAELAEFAALIAPLIREMEGPELTARTGKHCDNCKVRQLCPVQPEGMVVTNG